MTRKAGRPTKLTDDLAAKALDLVLETRSFKLTAERLGIARCTLNRWLARGESGNPRYAAFAESLVVHYRAAWRKRFAQKAAERAKIEKESWRKFKEGRADYWRQRLGEREFHRRRLAWYEQQNMQDKAEQLRSELTSQGMDLDPYATP